MSGHEQPRQCYWGRIAAVAAGIGAVGGHLRRDLGRAVVVVAVPDFSVSWHFRWSNGPQRPLLGLPGYGQSREYYWGRMATVGAAIGAVGGHLRRGLGLAVVVVVGVTGGGCRIIWWAYRIQKT